MSNVRGCAAAAVALMIVAGSHAAPVVAQSQAVARSDAAAPVAVRVPAPDVARAPASAADERDPTRFHALDVFELEVAQDPQISPDGSRIVFVRAGYDIMTDRRRTSLWIVNADGSDLRPLTEGTANASSPRWSPDGKRLLYVSSDEDRSQVFVRWMDTGQTAELTHLTRSPGGLAWSPDGKWIAMSIFVPEKRKPLAHLPPKPKGAKWAAPPKVITRVRYRADGVGYLEDGHRHLFVMPEEGGTPRQITFGPYNDGSTASWTPDSKALVFSANRRDDAVYHPRNSEVYRVDVATGEVTQLTDRNGPDSGPRVSPDGSKIAYTGFDDRYQGYQVSHLYVMNADGSGSHMVGDLDRSVGRLTWSADGRAIYFQYDDEGNTRVAYTSLDGKIENLVADVGGLSLGRPYGGGQYSVSRNGRIAFTHTRPDHPADLAVGGKGAKARRLTRLNDDLLGHKTLGKVEEMWWKSSYDGRDVEGWLVTPPDFDASKKYPFLLEIHGGPFANYGSRFAAEIQIYATAGYVVLYANPRGSTSYGEEFGNLIHHNYPGQDYDDLMSGVDAVVARGFVDPDQLYVTGGSGGGVLSAWIVGKTDRFRAAVVAKPVINWTSFALTSDGYPSYVQYWFPGPPWEYHEQYWKRSPLSLVGNVKTPTMIMVGEQDHRTPPSETEQFYQALQLRHVPTAMVRIQQSGHGIARRPSNLIAKVEYVLAWFARYRGGSEAVSGASR